MTVELDLERVLCRLADLAGGARGFTLGGRDWPLRIFVVKSGETVHGYVNRCPHAGHALDLLPQRFLTADGSLILCSSHGALFEKSTGYCVAGPCAGAALTPVPLQVSCGLVLLDEGVDVDALAGAAR
ncbi:MAG: Rieske 2Fe-2S domain-containing protein [Gammaproteobacteria bacterium]|nr:Rieske 2Fe-2S domain-containing protein [Gammaproteobacteria bacterium]MBV8405130.1 Rieske 2Fe-2S domain-containing protein [Gammaproteobacteria bacterium]